MTTTIGNVPQTFFEEPDSKYFQEMRARNEYFKAAENSLQIKRT